jgi:hypothetical protein
MVVVADDARDLPVTVLELPEVDELGFAHAVNCFASGMEKAVNSRFDRAITV